MNTKKLRELAAITQLVNTNQQPQFEQQRLSQEADRSRMQNMLGILGLLGHQGSEDEHLGLLKQQLAGEQQYHTDTLKQQEKHYADETARSQNEQFTHIAPFWSQLPPQVRAFYEGQNPALAEAGNKIEKQDWLSKYAQALPQARAVQGKDPKMQTQLGDQYAAYPGLWQQVMNETSPGAPTEAPYVHPAGAPPLSDILNIPQANRPDNSPMSQVQPKPQIPNNAGPDLSNDSLYARLTGYPSGQVNPQPGAYKNGSIYQNFLKLFSAVPAQ